jgi:hypothetical protein
MTMPMPKLPCSQCTWWQNCIKIWNFTEKRCNVTNGCALLNVYHLQSCHYLLDTIGMNQGLWDHIKQLIYVTKLKYEEEMERGNNDQ